MGEIRLYNAANLDGEAWRDLQTIARDSFAMTLDRSQDEIDALVEWDDQSAYRASHVDPNSEVGKRYNEDQAYTKPRVAVAFDAGKPVGFAYSANNVSGAKLGERTVKRLSVVKNYLWIREIAVAPEYQHQGVANALGKTLLKKAILLQPPTVYVWPEEIESVQEPWKKLGFRATGEQQSVIFGEGSAPVKEVRMQADSVRAVLQNMHQ